MLKITIIRFFIQIIFLILSLWILLGKNIPHTINSIWNAIHLFPNFSHFSWILIPPFIAITLITLFLPLLLGRIYCSYICPVGFIQDICFSLKKKFLLSNKTVKVKFFISNALLIIALYLCLSRSGLYGVIDHYTNYGRLLSLYKLNFSLSFIISIIFIIIITIIPIMIPRFFCQTICPSGAIYRLINKLSFLVIKNKENCTSCKICEKHCPTVCIQEGEINKDFCISCFQCLESCPQKTFQLIYKNPLKRKNKTIKKNSKRRIFLKNILYSLPTLATSISIEKLTAITNLKTPKTVIPPGGKSAQTFLNTCIGCNRCISICPTNVLISDSKENGLGAIFAPKMDYNNSYCSYECNACLSVCPTEALSYYTLKQKQTIQVGISKINQSSCIPYRFHRDCGSCAEHCPTGAVVMHKNDNIAYPRVEKKYCIGCGICQHVCPTNPRSIKITPLAIHSVAYDPRGNANPIDERPSDFPF